MNDDLLWRATTETHVEGRTLLGIAVPWDKPALVRDSPVSPEYLEAFTRSSADESLRRDPSPRPLFYWHEYKTHPRRRPVGDDGQALGVVHFMRSEEGLLYRAHLSRTRKADQHLELVNDGAERDVSLGFNPVQARKAGDVTLRTEVGLVELSLAPTGFGLHPGAKVLAVRAGDEDNEELEETPSGLVVPPAADQALRLRARRPLLAPKQIDPPE